MIYRGAAERKNNEDNNLSREFTDRMRGAQVSEKIQMAIQQYHGGNRTGGESLAREAVSSVVGSLERLRQSAVGRTIQAIEAEHNDEVGCDQTNGQRRGEGTLTPDEATVEQTARRQLDGIVNLVTEALHANAVQVAEQPSWEGRSINDPGIFDELVHAGYRHPYYRQPSYETPGRWIISRPSGHRYLRRLTVDRIGVIHHTEE